MLLAQEKKKLRDINNYFAKLNKSRIIDQTKKAQQKFYKQFPGFGSGDNMI